LIDIDIDIDIVFKNMDNFFLKNTLGNWHLTLLL